MHLQIKVGSRVGITQNEFLDEVLATLEEKYSLAGLALDPADGSVRLIPVGAEDPEQVSIHHEIIDEVIAHLVSAGFDATKAQATIKELDHARGALRSFLSSIEQRVPGIGIESILVLVRPNLPTATVSIGLDQALPEAD